MATTKYDISVLDAEGDTFDEDEIALSTSNIIRKDLFDNLLTPLKMTRQSVEHNKEPIKVYLRIRPFTGTEIEDGESQDCMEVVNNSSCLLMHAPRDSFNFKNIARVGGTLTHKYTFSNIFHEDTSQKRFFDETMLGTVKDFVDGQNCLVFTYGVTNAGKTHTIQGTAQDGGILPRSLDVLFNSTDGRLYPSMRMKPKLFADVVMLNETQLKEEESKKAALLRLAVLDKADDSNVSESDSSRLSQNSLSENSRLSQNSTCDISTLSKTLDETKDGEVAAILNDINLRIPDDTSVDVESQGPVKFSIWVSFIEIYNEYIYDLLEPMPKGKKARRPTLKLAQDKNGNVYIRGMKEVMVTSSDEAYKILKIGQKNLSIASTKLNHCSSRSHCVFSVKVLRVVDVDKPHVARVSTLSFCDLAGSERSTKTQAVGDRMKEAANINTSLLTLGKCIKVLRYNQHHQEKGQKVIPFRESKLTRLFQSFFMGHGKASMIVNVNQCASMFDETMHVLKFSAIAKQVTTVTSKLENKLKPLNTKSVMDKAVKTPLPPRQTIGWADPEDRERNGSDDTIIEDDEEEGSEEERNKYNSELLSVIETLKQRLVEEKQKQIMMESKIREEVCNEMAQQLVNIEAEYSMMNKQMQVMQEEKCEKRIEMYMQSVKKNRKRPRMDDEEDEWVSSVLLHAEESKVKERDETIQSLNNLVSSLQEEVRILKEDKEAGQQSEVDGCGSSKPTNESTEVLEKQVSEMRETILKQQSEVTELQETLNDAAEEFHAKKEEIERLKEKIAEDDVTMDGQNQTLKDLQQVLQDSKTMLEAANVKLKERDSTIGSMQVEMQQVKQCFDSDKMLLKETNLKLEERDTTIKSLNEEINELNDSLNTTKIELKESKLMLLERGRNIENMEVELQKLKESLNTVSQKVELPSPTKADDTCTFEVNEIMMKNECLEEKVKKMEAELVKTTESTESEKHKNEGKITELEDELENYRNNEMKMKEQISKLERSVKEHETALNDNDTFLEQLNKQVKEFEEQKEKMELKLKENDSIKTRLDEQLKANEEMAYQIEESNDTLRKLQKENDEIKILVEEKEQQLKINEEKLQKADEINEMKSQQETEVHKAEYLEMDTQIKKISEEKHQLEDLNFNLKKLVEGGEKEVADLEVKIKKIQEEKCSEIQSLQKQVTNLIEEKKKQKEEQIRWNEMISTNTEEKQHLIELNDNMKKSVKEAQSKISTMNETIDSLMHANESNQQIKQKNEKQIEELNEKFSNSEEEKNKMTNLVEENKKKVEGLTKEIEKLQKERDHIQTLYSELEKVVKLNEEIKDMSDEKLRQEDEKHNQMMESKELQIQALQEKIMAITETDDKKEKEFKEKMELMQKQKEEIEIVMIEKEKEVKESLTKVRKLSEEKEIINKLFVDKEFEAEESNKKAKLLKEDNKIRDAEFDQLKKQMVSLKEENQNLKKQLGEVESVVERLNKTIEQEKMKQTEEFFNFQKLTAEKIRIETILTEQDKKQCGVNEKLETLDKENLRFEELLAEKHLEVDQLKETITELDVAKGKIEKVVEEREKKINILEKENKKMAAEIMEVNNNVLTLNKELLTVKEDYNEKETEMEEVCSKIGKLEKEKEDLEKQIQNVELDSRSKNESAMNEKVKSLTEDIERLSEEIDICREEINDLLQQKQEDQITIQCLTREKKEAEDKLKFREEQMDKISARIMSFEDSSISKGESQTQSEETKSSTDSQESEAFSLQENPTNEDTSRIEMDVTPLQKKNTRKQRATRRGRKRKSMELAMMGSDDDDFQPKTSKIEQPRRSRRTTARKVETGNKAIKDKIPSPGTESISKRSGRRAALTKLGDMFHNKAKKIVDVATNITPQKSPPRIVEMHQAGTDKKKKRKLYKTDISSPFECNPHEVICHTKEKEAENSHGIVTRKLRSRQTKI